MKSKPSRGFTLIELLVVIAIIGLLASIILASLNSARSKGGDATIKGDLDSIRDQAEIDFDKNSPNAYNGTNNVCTDSVVTSALASAKSAGGTGTVGTNVAAVANATNASASGTCNDSATAYAVEMPLNSNALNFWCVDSTGKSEQTATALTGSGSGEFVCP